MDPRQINSNPQRSTQSNWLMLSLRLLGGAILGYPISFLLLILSETRNLPLLGWAISGQEELFDEAFFWTLYEKWQLMDFAQVNNAALFAYGSLWAFIAALLVSGSRKLIRLGVIFFILYVLTGCLAYIILGVMRIPT